METCSLGICDQPTNNCISSLVQSECGVCPGLFADCICCQNRTTRTAGSVRIADTQMGQILAGTSHSHIHLACFRLCSYCRHVVPKPPSRYTNCYWAEAGPDYRNQDRPDDIVNASAWSDMRLSAELWMVDLIDIMEFKSEKYGNRIGTTNSHARWPGRRVRYCNQVAGLANDGVERGSPNRDGAALIW